MLLAKARIRFSHLINVTKNLLSKSFVLPTLAGALLGLVIAASAVLFVMDLHDRAVSDTEQNLISLTTVLADQADRALQAIELVQEAVIDEVRAAEITTPAAFDVHLTTRAMHESLRARTAALPQVNAVTVVDHTGRLRNFTRFWPIPDVNISDRDYFQALASDPALQRFISEPVQNRGNGTWTLYIARKISAPDGNFLGLVLGAVELHYFTGLYSQIAPQPDYVISMFRTDGVLLVRHPHWEGAIGRGYSTTGAALIAAQNRAGGVTRTVSPIDAQDRFVATRTLSNYPAILSVSRTTAAALAPWHRHAMVLGLSAGLLDLGLVGLLVLGFRQARGQEMLLRAEEQARSERDLRHQYARFGIALDNMAQGVCLFDSDDRLVVMNARYIELYAVPSDLRRPGTTLASIRAYLVACNGDRGPPWPNRERAWEMPAAFTWDLADGRAIAIKHVPNRDGWQCTHEDITDRRQSEAQILRMARHDTLTGLPNRAFLREHLETVLDRRISGSLTAALYLDLDGFKMVNDTLGHPAGDALLRQAAQRLQDCLRATDFVARLGGDEFAIVQSGIADPADAADLAARIGAMLQIPFTLQDQEIVVGTSIGIAVVDAEADTDSDTILRRADVALYQAKAAGRGTWRFFADDMDTAIQRRHRLGAELRRALAAGQFELHYQPLVAVRTRTLNGFEALLRWRHPEHGLISPATFIPLAEETGLIRPIGAWVLAQACHDAVDWPDALKVAVNLSSVQFVRGDLVNDVAQALMRSGLPASRLELEITESVLLQDNAETLRTLHRLQALGLRIAMDDFGTGYSSVSYLRRFPFDKLKIDQSFVRTLGREAGSIAIVRAMVGLGKACNMGVVAEGVETLEQAAILEAEGCDEVQGFLFSRPLPLADLTSFLANPPSAISSFHEARVDAKPQRDAA
ncbi:EAL domain-containing protein [Methylobacterium sp. 37f]|uniref:bifunctional diguanylate cyclase/phosphodiesterase n=1 Tax=Methylobacterium sp. 37f TaxID=2817058 RepID=UPI001FFCD765|nr:EAL domain-containing protein [Methylobacterium sp. 37f]MCK2055969.1 EAL domain-containing protein [Methylobacterium sp. 37f]